MRRISSLRPIPARPHGLGASVLTRRKKEQGEAHRNRSANCWVSSGSRFLIVVRTAAESNRFLFLMSHKPLQSMRSCPNRPHTRSCRSRHTRHDSCCNHHGQSQRSARSTISFAGRSGGVGRSTCSPRTCSPRHTPCSVCTQRLRRPHRPPKQRGRAGPSMQTVPSEQLSQMAGAATQMTRSRPVRHVRRCLSLPLPAARWIQRAAAGPSSTRGESSHQPAAHLGSRAGVSCVQYPTDR